MTADTWFAAVLTGYGVALVVMLVLIQLDRHRHDPDDGTDHPHERLRARHTLARPWRRFRPARHSERHTDPFPGMSRGERPATNHNADVRERPEEATK